MHRPYEMVEYWPEGAYEIVRRTVDYERTPRVLYGSNNSRSYSTKRDKSPELVFAISYQKADRAYIVWDVAIERLSSNRKYDCGAEARKKLDMGLACGEISYGYKENWGLPGCAMGVEKVLLVEESALYEFCKNYERYLYPQTDDDTGGRQVIVINAEGRPCAKDIKSLIRGRKIDVFARQRRDPTFRNRVLVRDGRRCRVCGATEECLLQAAHIVAVSEGGGDEVENGICLCANHHLLYDNALLNIDVKNNRFECLSASEQQREWYKKAQDNDFSLLPRIQG